MLKKRIKKKASKSTKSSARKKKKFVKTKKAKLTKTQLEKDMQKVGGAVESTLELQDKHHWKPFLISILIVFAVAFIGNSFTARVVQSAWYESIKPAITPPNWVFPIVWNILFFLIATSMYLAWIHSKKASKRIVAWEFGVNLFLNGLWSYLFFGLKQPLYAFFALIFL